MDVDKLLNALDNENNSRLINMDTTQIENMKRDILKELELNDENYNDYLKKLKEYIYIDELNDLKEGGFIRWIQLNNDANIGSYFLNSSGGTEYLLNNTTLDYNWHHIVITKGSTNGHIMYYDNVAIATDSSFTGNVYNNLSTTNKIGRTFKGQIDQVRIFNKELSAGEVTTLYNETACN